MSREDETQTYGVAAAERRQRKRRTSEQIKAVVAPRCETPMPQRTIKQIVDEAVSVALDARDAEWQADADRIRAERDEAMRQRDALRAELEQLRRELGL